MKTPQEKYLNDINYKNLVDTMHSFISKAEFTPSELREAAILASIHYESLNIRRYTYMVPRDVDGALKTIRNYAETYENGRVPVDTLK